MSNISGYIDPTLNNHNLINTLNSSPTNLSSSTTKRSARNNSSHSSVSYDNSMSLWSNDISSGAQDTTPPPQKGKSNKKESHNRIERKRRDYINAQIANLGNLLPAELYRDVSEGKRNKGSVLKLSVNYINDLQHTVSQMGSIQQENHLARQLIPILVRRVKTLQKALADLVEAIPHCLDVRLDDILEGVSNPAGDGSESSNQQSSNEIKSEDIGSSNDPFGNTRHLTLDAASGEIGSLAGSRKRPRRLVSAFHQAKCQLGSSNSPPDSISVVNNPDVSLNGLQNEPPVYEEEYQTWARLSEFNQKQELQLQQQMLSMNGNTPGANSNSTPCSVSSNNSSANNNNGSLFLPSPSFPNGPSSTGRRPNKGSVNLGLNIPTVSTTANSSNCSSPLSTGVPQNCRMKISSLGEAVSSQPNNVDMKLMYSSNLLPQSLGNLSNCIVGGNSLDCLMTSSSSPLLSSSTVPTASTTSSQYLISANGSSGPSCHQMLIPGPMHMGSPVDVTAVPGVEGGLLSRQESSPGGGLMLTTSGSEPRSGPLGLVLDHGIKSEQFDAGGITPTTTDDQDMLSTRATSLGYFQEHLMHQHLSSLDPNQSSSSHLDHEPYPSIDPTNGLHQTSSAPTLMHVGGLFSATSGNRRHLINSNSRSLADGTFSLMVDSQNLTTATSFGEDFE